MSSISQFTRRYDVADAMRQLCSDSMDTALSLHSSHKGALMVLDEDNDFKSLCSLCSKYKTARRMVFSCLNRLYKEGEKEDVMHGCAHRHDTRIMALLYALIKSDPYNDDFRKWFDWLDEQNEDEIVAMRFTSAMLYGMSGDDEKDTSATEPTALQEVLLEWGEWKRKNWPVKPKKDEEDEHEYVALPIGLWNHFVHVMERLEDVAEFSPLGSNPPRRR